MAEYRDPNVDPLRHAPSDRCWWCGDKATTREHKYKATELRRIASANGLRSPSNVFKSSSSYEGPLRSIKSGHEVQWGMNLCASCNGQMSQPFDRAYDLFSAYVVDHVGELHLSDRLDWVGIYGQDWKIGSSNLARYFGKQLGCMLATQDLDVPDDLVQFLNGGERCPSILFIIRRDQAVIATHLKAVDGGFEEGMRDYIGIPETSVYSDDDRLTGAEYAYRLGYLLMQVDWVVDSDRDSFFAFSEVDLPLMSLIQE